jgi:exonuclease VII small subunit
MGIRDRLAVAIARIDDALQEQRRHAQVFRQALTELDRCVQSIERGLHGYAATLARTRRDVERLHAAATTLQRIMTAAERGQAPGSRPRWWCRSGRARGA